MWLEGMWNLYLGEKVKQYVKVLGASGAALALAASAGVPAFAAGENRVAGADRVETAIRVAQSYSAWSNVAIVARADDYADALSASALGGAYNAPIFLTASNALDQRVADALGNRYGRIFIVGGTSAISPAVEAELSKHAMQVDRLGGDTRYATNLAVAKETAYGLRGVRSVVVARGDDFADALAGGALAVRNEGVLLLVNPAGDSEATKKALNAYNKQVRILAAGGPAADALGKVGGLVYEKAVGADRYETAVILAKKYFGSLSGAVLASGVNYPDALAVSVPAGKSGKPVLLTRPAELPASVKGFLADNRGELASNPLNVIGGPAAIAEDVLSEAQGASGGKLSPAERWTPAIGQGALMRNLTIQQKYNDTTNPFLSRVDLKAVVGQDVSSGSAQAFPLDVAYTGKNVSSLKLSPDANTDQGGVKLTIDTSGSVPQIKLAGGTTTFAKAGTYTWTLTSDDTPAAKLTVVASSRYTLSDATVKLSDLYQTNAFLSDMTLKDNGTVAGSASGTWTVTKADGTTAAGITATLDSSGKVKVTATSKAAPADFAIPTGTYKVKFTAGDGTGTGEGTLTVTAPATESTGSVTRSATTTKLTTSGGITLPATGDAAAKIALLKSDGTLQTAANGVSTADVTFADNVPAGAGYLAILDASGNWKFWSVAAS